MRAYLAAERAYYDRWLESVRGLRDELAGELTARVIPAEESVSWRRDGHSYFTRTVPGREFEQFCRAGDRGAPALLDENLLLEDPACAGGYVALGVREVSPDGQLLAYSVDFDGNEVYQLRIRDLASGADSAERIEGTYYGLAWAADSRSLLYVVTDAQYRRHEVGATGWAPTPARTPWFSASTTGASSSPCGRPQRRVPADRGGIEGQHRDPGHAGATGRPPAVLEKRRPGIEYWADHADGPDGGEFFLVTNAGAAEFRLVRTPASAPGREGWTEVIGPSPDTRLVSCDVFGGTWWSSSGTGPRPSCASWIASPGTSG